MQLHTINMLHCTVHALMQLQGHAFDHSAHAFAPGSAYRDAHDQQCMLCCCCRGPGVVGETPVLEPGKSFEYNSACPLATPTGTMQGEFEMIRVNDIDPSTRKPASFQAKIAEFALDMQQAVMI